VSALAREVTRLRRLVSSDSVYLRRAPATIVFLAGVGVVTWLLVATADKWSGILQGFAANVVAAVVLAIFAYVVFVLRFRRAKLVEYVDRYRRSGDETPARAEERVGREPLLQRAWNRLPPNRDAPPDDALARTVRELLKARPPRSCLLVSSADVARKAAMRELPALLAAGGLVPVIADLHHDRLATSIPEFARSRFVNELVGSAGDAASAGRLFASLLGRNKIVAVVIGLETWSTGMSIRARQEAVAELIRGCLVEHLSFVAALPDELTPAIDEIAVLRIPAVSHGGMASYMARALTERGLEENPDDPLQPKLRETFATLEEPTRDPSYLDLASDLLVARVRRGQDAAEVLAELFADPRAFRRHLGWLCEWALACELSEASTATSPAALALATVGAETHYRQELPTTWGDATATLDGEAARRFAAGVSILAQKDVLSIADGSDGTMIRFGHSGWSSFAGALGLKLDPSRWSDLLRPGAPQATLDALTAALVLDDTPHRRPTRSFVKILADLRPRGDAEISLDMATAVMAALQIKGIELDLGSREREVLDDSWTSSTDPVRLAFVNRLDFRRDPELVEFLWDQVVPPAFHVNAYLVRRTICERLASLGPAAWQRLRGPWTKLPGDAAGRNLLPRRAAWDEVALAIASLCWILPALALRLAEPEQTDALALLSQLRTIVAKGWDTTQPSGTITDIGIEISLAEGFKISGADLAATDVTPAAWWYEEARAFFDGAKSWLSRSVLLQGYMLADKRGEAVRALAEETMLNGAAHPFVRETAALVLRALELAPDGVDRLQYVWPNDVQALDDGGLELAPEAHRLLALSTLLINLAEHSLDMNESGGMETRVRALTSEKLPACFCRASHTATMFRYPCDCGFDLCGPEIGPDVGLRKFSRAFVKRAEMTCRATIRSGRRGFTRSAFGDIWRDLDQELARPS
jgi:hypothetical protein